MKNVKSRTAMLLLALTLALLSIPRAKAFSSMYVYGDGVCATNDWTAVSDPLYYELRNCNGRVWVEVLWEWQGLAFDNAKNKSYFGHVSSSVVTETAAFAGTDAATALFVIWCANADFVEFVTANGSNWAGFISNSVANHVQAATNIYDKGGRTIMIPNAVDIMAVPSYNGYSTSSKAVITARVIEFNAAFKAAMVNLAASKPGLTIYQPDAFSFFEQVLADPSSYGLQNPLPLNAPVYDIPSANKEFGPGIDYVFWDDYHPTAKFQMLLADFFQQIVSPVKVNSIACAGGNVLMQVANVPLGDRAGSIQGSSNLLPPWSSELSISEPFVSGGSTTKSYSFPASGAKRFYRVGFPVVWTWP
jgi:hypothetical protein